MSGVEKERGEGGQEEGEGGKVRERMTKEKCGERKKEKRKKFVTCIVNAFLFPNSLPIRFDRTCGGRAVTDINDCLVSANNNHAQSQSEKIKERSKTETIPIPREKRRRGH